MDQVLSAVIATEAEVARLRRELEVVERRLATLRRAAGLPVATPTPVAEPSAPMAQAQTRISDATTWLQMALASGPLPAREIRQRAASVGLSLRSVQRAARHAGVQMRRHGFSATAHSTWALPAETDSEGRSHD
jgi:hypothetical protein